MALLNRAIVRIAGHNSASFLNAFFTKNILNLAENALSYGFFLNSHVYFLARVCISIYSNREEFLLTRLFFYQKIAFSKAHF